MNREFNLRTVAYALPGAAIASLAGQLSESGYAVDFDKSAGFMVARADSLVVVRALRMGGRGARWSLRADPTVIQTKQEAQS